MKNLLKLIGIAVLVSAIGFSLVSCDDDTGGNGGGDNGGGGGGSSLNGTYQRLSSDMTITFRTNGTFTGYGMAEGPVNGNYTVSGDSITLSTEYIGTSWRIVDSNMVMDGSGYFWTRR